MLKHITGNRDSVPNFRKLSRLTTALEVAEEKTWRKTFSSVPVLLKSFVAVCIIICYDLFQADSFEVIPVIRFLVHSHSSKFLKRKKEVEVQLRTGSSALTPSRPGASQ